MTDKSDQVTPLKQRVTKTVNVKYRNKFYAEYSMLQAFGS